VKLTDINRFVLLLFYGEHLRVFFIREQSVPRSGSCADRDSTSW